MSIVAFFGRAQADAALSVTASPNVITGTFTNSPASNLPLTRDIITETTTATATGGAGGYTYSWARVSGSALISAQNPSGANTNFLASNVPINTSVSAIFRVTVTDAASNTASADVSVAAEYLSGF